MRIAWLLRADLRQGAPAEGPVSDWFRMWWLVNGSHEYPGWVGEDVLRESKLFTPMPEWPMYGGFGMTPALRFLLETRKDLAAKFDVSTNKGLWDAIAWLFVHGIQEHQLFSAIDRNTLAALDATPPFFANKSTAKSNLPEMTWLMFFVWKTSDSLQKQFDLQRTKDRQAYTTWFLLNGVHLLKIEPLIMPRWKDWLREPVSHKQGIPLIPRAAYLLRQQHRQLQLAFDLKTENSIKGFALWTAEVWNTQTEFSWIDDARKTAKLQDSDKKKRPFGVNLIGFAFGELGIGEDVRMAVAACESAGIPFSVVNINAGDGSRQADNALALHFQDLSQKSDQAPYAVNIFCLTAFDTARVFLEKSASLFNDRYNIGWWPWELPVWPQDWLAVCNLVDEIWSATSFTHQMYIEATYTASSSPTPVTLMPMAVSVDRVESVARSSLGLSEGKFLFLYVFDFNSYLVRKNPLAAVEAFRKAFSENDLSVGLILKTMNSNPDNLEWQNFLSQCNEDCRIRVIDKTMERGKVLGLIQACDGYISLHRAEGFGRTLAEAMLFGKPVVATNFSGNVDFLTESTGFPVAYHRISLDPQDYPFIESKDSAWWAQPCIEHASRQLREAKNTWDAERSTLLKQHSQQSFSPKRVGRKMKSRLKMIELKFFKENMTRTI